MLRVPGNAHQNNPQVVDELGLQHWLATRMVPVTARPYPWTALERVPRKALRRLGELREHAANLRLDEVAAALETLVGARVRMTLATLHIGAPPQMLTEVPKG